MEPWVDDKAVSVAAILKTVEGRDRLKIERALARNELVKSIGKKRRNFPFLKKGSGR